MKTDQKPLHEILAPIAGDLPIHWEADLWVQTCGEAIQEPIARYAILGWLQDDIDKQHRYRVTPHPRNGTFQLCRWIGVRWACVGTFPDRFGALMEYQAIKEAEAVAE